MSEFILKSLDFVAQFTGGRGGIDHPVNYGIGALMFAVLLLISIIQNHHQIDREKWLRWGFGLGLARELFMILMSYIQAMGFISPESLHVFFPPLEHALSNTATIVIAAAFLRYILNDNINPKRYMLIALSSVAICYLATFWWWAQYITNNPTAKFGQTWGDWLFRLNASIWLFIPIIWLYAQTRGWRRNTICLALTCFFLTEFLKIPDMALGEAYEHIFTPIRHGLYLLAIPMFGLVYLREMFEYQEQMKKDLHQSQVTLENVFQHSTPMCITNKNHEIVLANAPYFAIFGGAPGETTTCHSAKHCDLCNTDQCPFLQVAAGKEIVTIDTTRPDLAGNDQHFIVTARPFHNADGDFEGIIKSFQDVTARKLTEQANEVMKAQLIQSQKLESLGTLASGIAHDFNNILFAIIGYTELAKKSAPEEGRIKDDLAQILVSANRATDLVKQILLFGRVDDKGKEPIQIQNILIEILTLLHASIPKTIDIQLRNKLDCGTILADSTQIHQVLINICSNAVQAMDEKGQLEIWLQEIELNKSDISDLPDLKPGKHIKLTIRDTGHGMDKATTAKIFDPFFTTKTVGEGTGLGLSVVHGIVKNHQGMITVTSELHKGTTFTLFFPIVESNKPDAIEVSELIPTGNERILFVDDEKTLIYMGKRILEHLGYRVAVRSSSIEALKFFKSSPEGFDLVITDQAMPDLSGVELAAKLIEIRPDIPIILCTGFSNKITQEVALKLGIKEFCLKPLDAENLAKIVRKVLDGKQE